MSKRIPVYLSEAELTQLVKDWYYTHAFQGQNTPEDEKLLRKLEEQLDTFIED